VPSSCPPKSPVDQLAGLAKRELGSAADPAGAESALVARLSRVPDLRRRRGRRHPLVAVLALAACATLVVGGDSVTAIWQWAARASQDKLARLGARRNPFTGRFLVPSERTFRRVLAKLDADALDAAIGGWAAEVARGAAPAPVVAAAPGPLEREERRATQRSVEHPAPDGLLPAAAVDGKALRGARTPEGGRVFLVAAIDHTTGAVLGQRQVPSKRGEGAAARALLTGLQAPGMVWTLDALHTTKATARLITQDLHGHYILVIIILSQAVDQGSDLGSRVEDGVVDATGRGSGCWFSRGRSLSKSDRRVRAEGCGRVGRPVRARVVGAVVRCRRSTGGCVGWLGSPAAAGMRPRRAGWWGSVVMARGGWPRAGV
jgi:DDE_Tnp_1-associated